MGYGYTNVLDATMDLEGETYRPRTKETKQTYELILAFLNQLLGDIQQDVLRSAADKYGVAVIFDEDEEEEVSSQDEYEVREQEQDEEGLQEADSHTILKTGAFGEEEESIQDLGDDFTTVLKTQEKKESHELELNVEDIDAFWLQRTIGQYFPDAQVAQEKANEAFDILSSVENAREIENALMSLCDYSHFELVKLLTKNRQTIVFGIKMARSSSFEDKIALQKEYDDLVGSFTRQDVIEEDQGQVQTRESMDIDIQEPLIEREKVDKSALIPKKPIDLESLVFTQGSHIMSNKKVKLPEGSFKRTKKGYEEIHVPAPTPKPLDDKERLVSISELPSWSQKAFKGAKTLNRIQSKVYPIAFKEDENMLLCAPTGAGKYVFLF